MEANVENNGNQMRCIEPSTKKNPPLKWHYLVCRNNESKLFTCNCAGGKKLQAVEFVVQLMASGTLRKMILSV